MVVQINGSLEGRQDLAEYGFPGYSIDRHGTIINEVRGREVKHSQNQSGLTKVGLWHYDEEKQLTVSVALLVARAFLPEHQNPRFNTPINLDGDRTNVSASNLVWRPRWFAMDYHKQFHDEHFQYREPIIEINTKEWYPDTWTASIKNGLLEKELVLAIMNHTYVFPTFQMFQLENGD